MWRQRTWRCAEVDCTGKACTERHADLARPRGLLTTRAAWWAIGQLRREHASVAGIARQLGTTWRTVWRSIEPLMDAMAADEARFADVRRPGCGRAHLAPRLHQADRGRWLRAQGADRHGRSDP